MTARDVSLEVLGLHITVRLRQPRFETCSFINTLLEMGPQHPLGQAGVCYLANIRAVVRELPEQIPVRDPDAFAHSRIPHNSAPLYSEAARLGGEPGTDRLRLASECGQVAAGPLLPSGVPMGLRRPNPLRRLGAEHKRASIPIGILGPDPPHARLFRNLDLEPWAPTWGIPPTGKDQYRSLVTEQ